MPRRPPHDDNYRDDGPARPQEAHGDDIRALAQRIGNLADELAHLSGDVRVMTERASNRDDMLADIRQDVAEAAHDIDDFKKRLPTEAEMKVLRLMILGKDRIDWFKRRSVYYFFGALGTGTAIWAARDWIRALLVWLRILPT